jgi:methylaspartate ammonia-lyase
VSVEPLGEPKKIFDGDATHPPLFHKDVFAFLPFQIDDHRFAVAVYVMTHDYTQDMPPEDYRLTISGVNPQGAKVAYVDPITGSREDLKPESSSAAGLRVKLAVVDYPRILTISEAK